MLRTLDMIEGLSDSECPVCKEPNSSKKKSGKVLTIDNQRMFVCEDHLEPFMLGRIVGNLELNGKIAKMINTLPDESTGWALKEQIYELVPPARRALIEKERITQLQQISPKSLYSSINKTVVGQDNAKIDISLSVYEHLRSLQNQNKVASIVPDKHNVLLLGPSGCGKTLIAHSVSQTLQLPFVSADATGFSPTGYQGADADTMIHELYYKAHGSLEAAEHGIVFIDEIDKLAAYQGSAKSEYLNHNTQSSLLRLIEGKNVKIPMTQMHEMAGVITPTINTTKVLFFAGGAFPGLVNIVSKKMGYTGRNIGLRAEHNEYEKMEEAMRTYNILADAPIDILFESLIEYGLTAELLGRFPTIVPLAPLTIDELRICLLHIDHAPIKKQQSIFLDNGYVLRFEPEAIEEIIDTTRKMATGTRALTSLVKKAVSRAKFELCDSVGQPGKKQIRGIIVISKETLANPSSYQVIDQSVHASAALSEPPTAKARGLLAFG